MENLQKLEKILGYEFKNKQLLRQALTHSSYSSRLSEITNGWSFWATGCWG